MHSVEYIPDVSLLENWLEVCVIHVVCLETTKLCTLHTIIHVDEFLCAYCIGVLILLHCFHFSALFSYIRIICS